MIEKILVCENTVESIFTAIFEAYENKLDYETTYLQIEDNENIQLFVEYIHVETNSDKAQKVARTILKRFGERSTEAIWQALYSNDMEKAQAVYQMIVLGLSGTIKGHLIDAMNNECIMKVVKLEKNVWYEEHHYKGFVRFEELKNGLLYTTINPKNDILFLLGNHFTDRLMIESFMIYDERRGKYYIHRKNESGVIVEGRLLMDWKKPELSSEEKEIQELFVTFYNTIAIKERKNLALQRNMMPLRFREHMTEFKNR